MLNNFLPQQLIVDNHSDHQLDGWLDVLHVWFHLSWVDTHPLDFLQVRCKTSSGQQVRPNTGEHDEGCPRS